MLEDNDILHLARGTYKIYNLRRGDPGAAFASVSRMLNTLDMEVYASMLTRPCNDSDQALITCWCFM